MKKRLSDEEITLLKGYFGQPFHKKIEELSDSSPRVLRILKENTKGFQDFYNAFVVAYVVLLVTVLIGISQNRAILSFINSEDPFILVVGAVSLVVSAGAVIVVSYILVYFVLVIRNESLLYEVMAILLEEEEDSADIKHFLRKSKPENGKNKESIEANFLNWLEHINRDSRN